MIPFFPLLLGAGLGAATSKKPLQGALLGAGMGALGGAVAPGLMGGGGLFGGATPPVSQLPMGADPLSAWMKTGGMEGSIVGGGQGGGAGGVGGGLFGGDTMKTLGGAANMAQMSGMFGDDPPVAPSPVQPGQGGAAVLAQLAQAGGQDPQLQAAAQARKQRRGLFSGVA